MPGHRRHLVHHDHPAAHGGGRGLGDEDRRRHDRDADRHAEEEARRVEEDEAGRDAAEDREQRVGERHEDHRPLAPDRVGEPAAGEGAEHRAGDDDRRHPLRLMGREPEVLGDEQQRAGDRPEVVAVDDPDRRRRDRDPEPHLVLRQVAEPSQLVRHARVLPAPRRGASVDQSPRPSSARSSATCAVSSATWRSSSSMRATSERGAGAARAAGWNGAGASAAAGTSSSRSSLSRCP